MTDARARPKARGREAATGSTKEGDAVNPVFREHFDLECRRKTLLAGLRTDAWVIGDAIRSSRRVTICAGGHELRHSWWLDAGLRRLRFMPADIERLRTTIERLRDLQPKYDAAVRELPPLRAARRG